ncbi:MAG: tetratricopeptide repeat protein [Polyangiaceae bacterium]
MLKALLGSVLASSLFWGALAAAQPPPAASTATPAPGAAGSARKDPRGIKGISPFREALNKGDSALIARDFELALVAYKEAIAKEPQNPLGHYRVGEAQIAKGDLHEAEEAFLTGLRFASATDSALKAKLQFALADLRERQKAWDEASAKWTDYETFTTEQKLGFPDSGIERKRTVEAWKKLSADSAEVKARIEKGIAAADEAVRKSSK